MKAVIYPFVFTLCVKILQILAEDGKSYNLPNGKINVELYTVKIIPKLKDDFSFEGDSTVVVKLLDEMKCITMNSKNLEVKYLYFEVYDRIDCEAVYKLYEDREMLEICFSKSLPPNTEVEIQIFYTGKISDDYKGLYKVQYEENGSKKWLAATLLEPAHARMVFPCFDEPQYNAEFSLSIARYPDQKSSSMTNLKSTSNKDPDADNRVWDIFDTSKPRTAYTVAFTVHSFHSYTSRTTATSQLTIHSRKHAEKDVEFFISNYPNWYKTLAEYLNTDGYYNLDMNIVALPDGDEFLRKGTTMIYKEKDVLHIDDVDVEHHKEEIMKAAIHKIYHLWMGVYARIHSWNDAWLRESFGVYFQYMIVNQIHPHWKTEDRFITEVLQKALFEEEMHPNSAVSSPTNSPSEILTQKYNTFINQKGASIIRMLQQVIGDYLQKGFKNAIHKAHDDDSVITPNDLWDEIDKQIESKNLLPKGTLVKNFMQTWLQSSDYPLITVLTNERGEVVIKQEMYHSPKTTNKNSDYNWIVPINCGKKSTPEKHHVTWLHDSNPVTTNYQLNKDEWVSCNFKQGYYRVIYSKENWILLTEQLKSQPEKMDNVVKTQLIDDAFHLATYKKVPFSVAINLGTYLEKESDMLPWFSFIKYITHFTKLYENTEIINYLKRYFTDLIKHQFNRLGFEAREDDSYVTKTGRSDILSIACQLGFEDCLTNSARVFNTHINDISKVPVELKRVVYCNSFETLKDKQAAWDKLWTVYKSSHTMSEKELMLSSLACVNDEVFIKKLVRMTMDSEESTLFQYEKECIIKSSVKLYNGMTAILETINEIIPKLQSQSARNRQTLLFIANEIYFNIDSSAHVEKAKQIVQQLENDKDRNADLLEIMRKSIDLGTKKVDYKAKNSGELKQAINDVMGYDHSTTTVPTTTTTVPPTTATSVSTFTTTASTHSSTASTSSSTHNQITTTNSPTITSESPKVPSGDCRVEPSIITCVMIIIGMVYIII